MKTELYFRRFNNSTLLFEESIDSAEQITFNNTRMLPSIQTPAFQSTFFANVEPAKQLPLDPKDVMQAMHDLFRIEETSPPEIETILDRYQMSLDFKHISGKSMQLSTLGEVQTVGLDHWKQQLIEKAYFKSSRFIIIGRSKGLYYFYCSLPKVTLLTEIPVRDLRYKNFLKNSSILLSRLQTLVSGYLEASEHLLIIEDKLSYHYEQSGCMLLGAADAQWIHKTNPLIELVKEFSE